MLGRAPGHSGARATDGAAPVADPVGMSTTSSSAVATFGTASTARDRWGAALALHAALSAVPAFVATVVWASVGFGYFWPAWVWFAVAVPLGLHGAIFLGCRFPPGRWRALALHGAVVWWLIGTQAVIWAMSGAGSPWPLIPAAALAGTVAVHAMVVRLWPGGAGEG